MDSTVSPRAPRSDHAAAVGEHRYRALVERSLQGVVMVDRDGRLLYFSPSTALLLGRAMDELLGRPGFDFVHPDDRPEFLRLHYECVQSPGASFSIITRVLRPDGTCRWILVEVRNLLDDPDLGAMVATFRDITEAHEAEDQRRAALETRARAVEQTADSILITDERGSIQYANPAFEQMTGYTRDELVGRNPRLLASGLTSPQLYQRLWGQILTGHAFRAVIVNRHKDGHLYHEDQTISPICGAGGVITHFVSTGRDISARQRTDEALRRLNAQLERETSRIAGIVHDEAGQFLSSAHMLLESLSRDVDPALRGRLQEVQRTLDQVEEQLRRVSREMHPRIVEDLGLLDAIRFRADAFTRRTGIAVTVEVAWADTPRPLAVDTLLYRFVQEGLTNIARHARATCVWVSLSSGEKRAQCSVRDNGIGFDVAAAAGRESGLGLRLIEDRLAAAGGTLTIVSASGSGADLRATVPLGT